MNKRDLHTELLLLEHERDRIKAACGRIPTGLDIDQHVAHMRTALMRAEALIRQMVEMSKEEGLVDFSGWIKAAEKYLEDK